MLIVYFVFNTPQSKMNELRYHQQTMLVVWVNRHMLQIIVQVFSTVTHLCVYREYLCSLFASSK